MTRAFGSICIRKLTALRFGVIKKTGGSGSDGLVSPLVLLHGLEQRHDVFDRGVGLGKVAGAGQVAIRVEFFEAEAGLLRRPPEVLISTPPPKKSFPRLTWHPYCLHCFR